MSLILLNWINKLIATIHYFVTALNYAYTNQMFLQNVIITMFVGLIKIYVLIKFYISNIK